MQEGFCDERKYQIDANTNAADNENDGYLDPNIVHASKQKMCLDAQVSYIISLLDIELSAAVPGCKVSFIISVLDIELAAAIQKAATHSSASCSITPREQHAMHFLYTSRWFMTGSRLHTGSTASSTIQET